MTTVRIRDNRYEAFFPIENSLGFIVYRTALHMKATLQRRFRQRGYNITTEQWSIMLSLWEQDGRTQQEIADKTGKNKANITRFIDALGRSGYLVRRRDPRDRRKYAIFLTGRGKDLRRKLMPIVQDLWRHIGGIIPPADLAVTRRTLNKIFDQLR
ncbi:MAG: MarR family winged helix-turn-helix transcriptional regulator [Nitrospiraceae bacterium]|nr:MarR family winged helix-turn-helix transcriptional regulator [Nitrospiraceae bacterium]